MYWNLKRKKEVRRETEFGIDLNLTLVDRVIHHNRRMSVGNFFPACHVDVDKHTPTQVLSGIERGIFIYTVFLNFAIIHFSKTKINALEKQ